MKHHTTAHLNENSSAPVISFETDFFFAFLLSISRSRIERVAVERSNSQRNRIVHRVFGSGQERVWAATFSHRNNRWDAIANTGVDQAW